MTISSLQVFAEEADMVWCVNSVLGDVELDCPGSSLVLPLLALWP